MIIANVEIERVTLYIHNRHTQARAATRPIGGYLSISAFGTFQVFILSRSGW